MPYIAAAQRYNSKRLSSSSESANRSLGKICSSNVAEEMTWPQAPPQNHLQNHPAGYENIPQERSAAYQNGVSGSRATDGESWQAPAAGYAGYGGFEQPVLQNDIYGAASGTQFYGGTGYGPVSAGRQPPWRLQQPATYQRPIVLPPIRYSPAYYPAVHTTIPQRSQVVEQQYYTSGSQQYAPYLFPYQPYLQSAQYGYAATTPWLTQQLQSVGEVPPPPPPPSSSQLPPPPPPDDPTNAQCVNVSGSSSTPRRSSKKGQPKHGQSSHQAAYFGQNFHSLSSDTQGYSFAPWQQSVALRSNTTIVQDQSSKTTTHAYNLRNQRPWRNAPSQPGVLATKPNPQGAQAGSDGYLHVLERPAPTEKYLQQANKEPLTTSAGRPLLVVVDMNGTLVHRTDKRRSLEFIARPRVNEFLHYLFSNHNVMIWSSSQPRTVTDYRKKLLFKDQDERLIACWARDKLRIPEHAYSQKVQVYKQLSWIWKDKKIQSQNIDPVDTWSQENTVLIDDSFAKAASEPYNILELEKFEGKQEQMQTDVLGQVVEYLETLRSERDVSAYVRWKPFAFDPEKSFDWTPIMNDMH